MSNIQIIEDDEITAKQMEKVLNDAAHHVYISKSLEDAAAKFEQLPIDLIILDVFLPDGNGFSFLNLVRQIGKGRHVPIIIATSKGDREMVYEAANGGANDFIVKPFDSEDLIFRVDKHREQISTAVLRELLLSLRMSDEAIARKMSKCHPAFEKLQVFAMNYQESRLLIIVGEDIRPVSLIAMDEDALMQSVSVFIKRSSRWQKTWPHFSLNKKMIFKHGKESISDRILTAAVQLLK